MNIFRDLIRTFIPAMCPVCGGLPADGTANMFCADCLEKIRFVQEPLCPGCGGSLTGMLDMCPDCLQAEAERPWAKAFSLYRMEHFGKELIHRFKYQNSPELARPLGHLAQMRLGDALRAEQFDLIVPVPLHWFRMIQRGYNQSEVLAQSLGRELNIPCCNVLRRRKWTSQQAKLTKKERISNLKGAFSIKNSTNVKKRAILLVDDVLTTGSTLASATNSLLAAGAGRVCIFVIARRQ